MGRARFIAALTLRTLRGRRAAWLCGAHPYAVEPTTCATCHVARGSREDWKRRGEEGEEDGVKL
jgi:hypothetical protein